MRLRTRLTAIAQAGRKAINWATTWDFAKYGLDPRMPLASLSRGGLATTVDATGAVVYGAHNLLANSRFVGAASGTPGTAPTSWPWLLTDGSTLVSGEEMTFSVVASGRHMVYQAGISIPANETRTLTAFIIAATGSPSDELVQLTIDSGSASISGVIRVSSGLGEKSISITAGSGGCTCAVRMGVGTGGATSGAASVTLKAPRLCAGSATEYVPTTTSARYLPRITHDPSTLARLGLLIEGQATNEIGSHSLASPALVTQTITVTAAQRTLQFVGSGTVTLSGAHSATVVGLGAGQRKTLTFTPTAGSLTITPSGSCTYPQIELGTAATSYIQNPGTGSAVRVVDSFAFTGSQVASAIGAGIEGTVIVEFIFPRGLVGPKPAYPRIISIKSSQTGNDLEIWINNDGAVRCGSYSGSPGWELTVTSGLTGGERVRVAISYSNITGNTIFSANGASATVRSGHKSIAGADAMGIGRYHSSAENQPNTTYAYIGTRPTAITGAALQVLSA